MVKSVYGSSRSMGQVVLPPGGGNKWPLCYVLKNEGADWPKRRPVYICARLLCLNYPFVTENWNWIVRTEFELSELNVQFQTNTFNFKWYNSDPVFQCNDSNWTIQIQIMWFGIQIEQYKFKLCDSDSVSGGTYFSPYTSPIMVRTPLMELEMC